jgi:hypothetical protein
MPTQNETIEFIMGKLRNRGRFSACAMFGEYALYADGKVVALVCDDRLCVKILRASHELDRLCKKGEPYPGAKLHYVVEEGQLPMNRAFVAAKVTRWINCWQHGIAPPPSVGGYSTWPQIRSAFGRCSLSTIDSLPAILGAVARSIQEKKTKAKRKHTS